MAIGNETQRSRAQKKGIILDVDGTLWDAVEVITDSWNIYCDPIEDVKGRITFDDMRGCLGKTMYEIADELFGYLPLQRRREVLGGAMQYEIEYLWDHPGKLYPDVVPVMERLHDEGWHLYIVSNCQKGYIEDYLRAAGREQLIEDYLCFEDTEKEKAFNIRLCADRNDLTQAVYVGDTAGDMAASRKAGVRFIYARYGFGSVDEKRESVEGIDAFSDLPEVLGNH